MNRDPSFLPTGPGFALGPFLCVAPGSGILRTGARAPKVACGPSHPLAFAGASRILGQVEAAISPITGPGFTLGPFLCAADGGVAW